MQNRKNSKSPLTLNQNMDVLKVLERIVDAGLAGVLFVAPLALAGRFAVGRLILIALIGITAVAWGFTRILSSKPKSLFISGAEWIVGAAVLIVVIQLMPLPSSVVGAVSPNIAKLLPVFHGSIDGSINGSKDASSTAAATNEAAVESVAGSSSIHWQQLSLVPEATRGALAMVCAYAMLFLVLVHRIRNKEDLAFLMKALALAGVSMAAIGLAQRFVGNGKFLWFLEHPSRDTLLKVKGTFVNENHFVHWLTLTLGPLLWWIVTEQQQVTDQDTPKFSMQSNARGNWFGGNRIANNQIVPFVGLVVVLLASLLSFSRGGLAVMTIAGVICTGLFTKQKLVGKRAIIGLAVVSGIAAICVWVHGRDLLARELGTLQTVSIEKLDENSGRRRIWSAVADAIPDFALLGTGVGSHRYIYPTYMSERSKIQYTHAESGYLHTLLESGGIGFLVLISGIGLSGYWIFRTLRSDDAELAALAVPMAAAFAVSLVHAIFDFNWFIPANMSLTIFLLAAVARSHRIAYSRETKRKVWMPNAMAWSVATVGLGLVSWLSVTHYWPAAKAESHWNEYLAWSLATNRFQAKSIGWGRQRNIGFIDPSLAETNDSMIGMLDKATQLDPDNGRAHVRMAGLCLRQFDILQRESDNPMGLAQIRDAAMASDFASHEDMVSWVMKASGENRVYLQRILWHATQGVRMIPTEGSGYLYLAEVAFLDPKLNGRERDLLAQAYRVRPHNASIQFVYGRHLLLDGKQEEAVELWKAAFRRGTRVRSRVIAAIGLLVSPQEILDTFQPDVAGLKDLFDFYKKQERDREMRFIGGHYVAELERQAKLLSGPAAGEHWFYAQYVHSTLGNVEAAALAAKNAVQTEPNKKRNHFACALRMKDAGDLEAAVKEFRWCLQRDPKNEELPIVISELTQLIREAKLRTASVAQPGRSDG